jgi:hypothetical protein
VDLEALVIALLGAGGIAGAVRAWRHSGPETESISVETMREVIGELRTELGRLADENRELHSQIAELRRTVAELTGN